MAVRKVKVKAKESVDEWLDEEMSDDEIGSIYDEASEYLNSMSRGSDREGEVNYQTPSDVAKQAASLSEKSKMMEEKSEGAKKKYVVREPMRFRGSTEGKATEKEMPAKTKVAVKKKPMSEGGKDLSSKEKIALKALAAKGREVVKSTKEGTGRRARFLDMVKKAAEGKLPSEKKEAVMMRLKKYAETKKKTESK